VFRPDAEGRPSLRRELGLVLAGDHRVLDGVRGAALLNSIVAYLEKPLRLLRVAGGR
jgi:pyruvate dehydrogenase E2 component (dihydrolipoamide acetyltransferase)